MDSDYIYGESGEMFIVSRYLVHITSGSVEVGHFS